MALDHRLSLACAVLTVSDKRTAENDTSCDLLARLLGEDGQRCVRRAIVADNRYQIRRVLSDWIVADDVQIILTNGGTGFNARNSLPEAVQPLFDREVEGFGELFRSLSYQSVGGSAIQSRALAGTANGRVIFCIPGSEDSCLTAWNGLLRTQLDSRTRPCNFASGFR